MRQQHRNRPWQTKTTPPTSPRQKQPASRRFGERSMSALDELAESLGGELGAIAARIERDLRLAFTVEVERLRADRAEFELRIERAVSEKLAALRDGPPGP